MRNVTASGRTLFATLGFFVVFSAGAVLADGDLEIPLRNWTVPPFTQAAAGSGGITTMTDVTPPRVFVGVAPCRVADTRGLPGFSGQAGSPALNTGPRTFQIAGTVPGISAQCGIPLEAVAVSLQFTIVTPSAAGNLVAWPGGPAPSVSVLNWSDGVTALGNGTIVPLSPSGSLTVQINAAVGNATAHLVIDLNGYFGSTLFAQAGAQTNSLVLITNSNDPTFLAINQSTICPGNCGVAVSTSSGTAISGSTADAAFSARSGVEGRLMSGVNVLAAGRLGTSYGQAPFFESAPPWAVFGQGDIGASGDKYFLDPHPTDATKVIGYIALEGPEAGTYFRGRGRFQNGVARIAVPEDFRLVTDSEGLTVQVTPIGAMASFAVLRAGLTEIVVESSRNVEFYYFVQGVRATSKRRPPIFQDGMFVPERADSRVPEWLTAGQKQRLVRNGTYREDGTVNMETARRNGWDRVWAERERPMPAPRPE